MTDQKTLTIKIRSVYGRELIYPASPEADLFCELLHVKTISRGDLEIIKRLGYEIHVAPDEPRKFF